ncbi:MAG: lipid-A-disaccharide synthase N-terminal domain-containing protein [Prevotella sp.]|nr:lipid-A-disaccharide synthase N-terminal domain-containing protein [Bacteroides sp.]MCM1366464.1 lipid-A-disaccharide synthase N-terminal domain-containing protein [Prevotella sp.]MCM1437056.1 lipid-A-disaccharide synthase N-terminal domain-containing protein [Prevotella sp.]
MPSYLVIGIGLLAQGFFSARILVQWILSERARKVLNPSIFWILSLAGSYLLCIYGWMRSDFAIILGQFISYYIYIYNLSLKGVWKLWPRWLRILLIITPLIASIWPLSHGNEFVSTFLRNENVPLWLLLFGSAGQIIFTLRFVYQWYVSMRRHTSELPPGFWILSLIGSLTIVSYAIFRQDPVLILGQSFGVVAYCRNLYFGLKNRMNE